MQTMNIWWREQQAALLPNRSRRPEREAQGWMKDSGDERWTSMKDSSITASDDTARAERRVFDAWLRRNREQEALSAAKWRQAALFLLPLVLVVATVTWYFTAH